MTRATQNALFGLALMVMWPIQIWVAGSGALRAIGVVGFLTTAVFTVLNIYEMQRGK